MRLATLALLLGTAACKPPEPVPAQVDANVAWFWGHADDETDANLAAAAAVLSVAGNAEARVDPLKARSRVMLTAAELAPVGLEANDPSTARGVLMIDVFSCTLDTLSAILSDPAQATLYPNTWDKYVRTLTQDRDAFLARTSAAVAWDAEVDVTFPVADSYTSTMKGSLRRVTPKKAEVPSDLLFARTWLPAPATFSATSTSYFRQDYEIEIFWEQRPGTIFHAYGMWRDVKIGGFNYTLDNNDFFNIVAKNLVDWDGKTAALCARP